MNYLFAINHLSKLPEYFLLIYKKLISHEDTIKKVYLITLALCLTSYLLAAPVKFLDTDLWYHLSGGRFFWDNLSIPSFSYFSFIVPEREWINYFWGFQAITYAIHNLTGYQGLIILKTAFALISCYFIARILIGEKPLPKITAIQLGIFALFIYAFVIREAHIRPHLASNLFIPVFIYILNFRPRYIPLLPILTILWVNLHGVEWPIGALICGTYFLQKLYNYRQTSDKQEIKHLTWVALCIPAMLINPYGAYIILAPFSPSSDIYLFIDELKPVSFNLIQPITENLHISTSGSLALLFLLFLASFFGLWSKRKLTITHIILSLGGLFLLTKGHRFIWEWLLLSLPLYRDAGIHLFKSDIFNQKKLIAPLAILLIVTTPINSWITKSLQTTRYPFDNSQLPIGTSEFIKKHNLTGKYVLPPSYAGYAEWDLFPQVKIHSDMEFPPFDGLDFFEYRNAVTTKPGLQHLLAKYNPELIAVDKNHYKFQQLAKDSNTLTPVYFDDALTLYINNKLHADLAEKHRIQYINPHKPLESIGSTKLKEKINELENILDVYPHTAGTITTLASLLAQDNQFQKAYEHTQHLVDLYPDHHNSQYLNGTILSKLGRHKEAIEHLTASLKTTAKKNTVYKGIAENYFLLEDFASAYKYFKQGFNPYRRNEELKHYFAYASSAFFSGEINHAKHLFTMILQKDDGEHDDIINNSRKILKTIDATFNH